jgi:prepilin-type N-terminal cleavage/methylation domain-containing protein
LRSSRAFTLIEMMISVGIIALLAGIVFAAMGPARERAREAVCTSNLHQIGLAYAMYAADHDGVEPQKGVRSQYYQLGLPSDESDDYLFKNYLKNRDVLFCPSYHGVTPKSQIGTSYLPFSRDRDRWADYVSDRGIDLPFWVCQWHNPSPWPYGDVALAPRWSVWRFNILRLGGQVNMKLVNGQDSHPWDW